MITTKVKNFYFIKIKMESDDIMKKIMLLVEAESLFILRITCQHYYKLTNDIVGDLCRRDDIPPTIISFVNWRIINSQQYDVDFHTVICDGNIDKVNYFWNRMIKEDIIEEFSQLHLYSAIGLSSKEIVNWFISNMKKINDYLHEGTDRGYDPAFVGKCIYTKNEDIYRHIWSDIVLCNEVSGGLILILQEGENIEFIQNIMINYPKITAVNDDISNIWLSDYINRFAETLLGTYLRRKNYSMCNYIFELLGKEFDLSWITIYNYANDLESIQWIFNRQLELYGLFIYEDDGKRPRLVDPNKLKKNGFVHTFINSTCINPTILRWLYEIHPEITIKNSEIAAMLKCRKYNCLSYIDEVGIKIDQGLFIPEQINTLKILMILMPNNYTIDALICSCLAFKKTRILKWILQDNKDIDLGKIISSVMSQRTMETELLAFLLKFDFDRQKGYSDKLPDYWRCTHTRAITIRLDQYESSSIL